MKKEWEEIELGNKKYFEIIGSGIDKFEGTKEYLSTECIKETEIKKTEGNVTFDERPSRANMQPRLDSVWFAKMQNTLKVYSFNKNNVNLIDKYLLSTGFAGIRILDNVDVDYIRVFFLSSIFNKIKDTNCSGATQKSINNKAIAKIKIPLPFSDGKPDLEKQKQVVAFLENLENLKEKRKKTISLLDKYLKSIFNDMFNEYFLDIQNFNQLKDFCEENKNSIKAGPFGSSLKKEFYVEKGYKIYGQEQVIRDNLTYGNYYIDDKKYQELITYKVEEGDILISLVGTYGKISIVPENFEKGIINPRLMKITLNKKLMSPKFFKFMFLSSIIRSQLERASHGGTMDIINVSLMKNVKFPNIPLDKQKLFVNILEKVEKLKEKQKQSLEKIEELFNSSLSKAFAGELI